MKVDSKTTVGELMERFPRGFAVGPGTSDNPGELASVVIATSHFAHIVSGFALLEGNRGYMVVDMDK